jgi:hypothetical protein
MTEREELDPRRELDDLTEDELRALEAEPLPEREVMSTLLWAPAPPTIVAPPLDGVVEEEGV